MPRPENSPGRLVHKLAYGICGQKEAQYVVRSGARAALFIRQGDLDRACGIYVAMMAAMVMTGLPRRHALHLLHRTHDRNERAKEVAAAFYFDGSDNHALVQFISEVAADVSCAPVHGTSRALLARAVKELKSGQLALLSIRDRSGRYMHWVMLVGIELFVRGKDERAIALLGLDPSCSPPEYRHYNWRLELAETGKGAFCSSTNQDGVRHAVKCLQLVAFP